jgi:hypothetical protein
MFITFLLIESSIWSEHKRSFGTIFEPVNIEDANKNKQNKRTHGGDYEECLLLGCVAVWIYMINSSQGATVASYC